MAVIGQKVLSNILSLLLQLFNSYLFHIYKIIKLTKFRFINYFQKTRGQELIATYIVQVVSIVIKFLHVDTAHD